jgi:ATP-dependent helicase Lhr and Lhr-like helicase
VRGGRFVSSFGGEQFALPEVLESLRDARHARGPFTVSIAGSDPMNLLGVLVPGERVPAVAGKSFLYSTEETRPHDAAALHAVHRRRARMPIPRSAESIPKLPEYQVRLF